jgi:hypothetical protein
MADMEQIEITRHHGQIVKDVEHLLKKYCRIMEWDVPEADEDKARTLVLQALQEAIKEVEAQTR